MKGIVITKIPDASWGNPKIARAVGNDTDPWGILAPLRGTAWEPLIPLIPSLILDQAFRGHATPLMRVLGPPPEALARRLPITYARCRDRDTCINSGPDCKPGPKMPDCWEGEGEGLEDREQAAVVSSVARLWRDKIPVVVVIPE